MRTKIILVLIILVSITVVGTGSSPYDGFTKSEYDYIYSSYDGVRKVMAKEKYGFIDEEGVVILPCIYDSSSEYHNGLAIVQLGKAITAVNTKGEVTMTFNSDYDYVKYYDGKYGIARKNNKDAIIDSNDNLVTDYIYDSLSNYGPYSNPIIFAENNSKYGFIDLDGTILTPIEYSEMSDMVGNNTGILTAKNNNKYGFVGKNGKILVPCIYDAASGFKDGFAVVSSNGKYGFVNNKGALISNLVYDNVHNFNEGLAAVLKGNKWGFIDITGKEVIPCIYEEVSDFVNGYASVKTLGKEMTQIESPVKQSRDINIYINNNWTYFDQEPINEYGRILVPFRGIAEAMDYNVSWDADKREVTLQNSDAIIHLIIGSDEATVNIFDDGKSPETILLDVQSKLIYGSTVVPIRFIAESIGLDVKWVQETKSVEINQ